MVNGYAFAALATVITASALLGSAQGQASIFDRDFVDIKFHEAYFGTAGERIEVNPGDKNVPFTLVMTNVGTLDITGIQGQLSPPFGFTPTDGSGPIILASAENNARAGEIFTVTFFVDLDSNLDIRQYPASTKIDYSRLREAGVRSTFFNFDFKVTGGSVINVNAKDPFLVSLQNNEIVIGIANNGTAPISGVAIQITNTQDAMPSAAQSTSNVERVVIPDTDWNVGNINPGDVKYLTSTIYVPGLIKGETLRLPLEISYFNAHGDRQVISRNVDFYIQGLIDIRIYSVNVMELSGRPTIIGEIINEGNEDALFGFVMLKPIGDSNISEVTQFIDEIQTDSPVPFNIQVGFDGTPQYGEHTVEITARYKDSLREEHFVTHQAVITIPEPPVTKNSISGLEILGSPEVEIDALFPNDGGQSIILVVAVAAVIGIVLYAVKRRRRREDAF